MLDMYVYSSFCRVRSYPHALKEEDGGAAHWRTNECSEATRLATDSIVLGDHGERRLTELSTEMISSRSAAATRR